MSNGHVRTGGFGNQSGGHGRRRRPAARGRRLGVTTALTGLVGAALIATTTPPATAAGALSADATAMKKAVQSLAVTLDALSATPTLQARLPLAGQSVSDVLGLDAAFVRSLGAAATSYDGSGETDLAGLVKALDASDTATLGVTATQQDKTVTVTLDKKTVSGRAYALHSDEALFLDGTSAPEGSTPLTGSVGGTLKLTVGSDGVVTLDPNASLSVALKGGRSGLTVPSRYGFTDVTAAGTTAYDVSATFTVRDPDGSLAITPTEWQTTPFAELAPVTIAGSAAVDLALDSGLVGGTGTTDGTVKQTLSGATQMTPTPTGDGAYAFPAPTVTTGTGLKDFAKITSGDALVALAQMAAAYTNAESRIDPRLPLVDTAVSQIGSAAKGLNELVEAQGAAAVTCGRANTSPPSATTVPGTTWYCQARTADPVVAGSASWKLAGAGTLSGATATTVGPDPTTNVTVTGSATEPDVSVSFKVAGTGGGEPVTFTAQRRMRTAQEMAARLSALPGGSATVPAYDATARALTFPVTSDVDPAPQDLDYAFGDLFRTKAHLRSIETGSKLRVDVGKVSLAGTLGLLLAPEGENVSVADRAFLKGVSGPELSVAGISSDGVFSGGTGNVGLLGVNVAGSSMKISAATANGVAPLAANIDTAAQVPAPNGGAPSGAAMLSKVLSAPGVTAAVPTTGAVDLNVGGKLTVTAPELPSGKTYETTLAYPVKLADTTTQTAALPTVTMSPDYATYVAPQDVAPQVTGVVTSVDGAKAMSDSRTTFTSALGPAVAAGDVLALTLTNLRTGASCAAVKVATNSLTCQEQGTPAGTDDLTVTWAPGLMSGGKVPNTEQDPDVEGDEYLVDNSWKVGDSYLISGDPVATRTIALGALGDVASAIAGSDDAAWNTPFPALGIAPAQLAPQLSGVQDLVTELSALVTETEKTADLAPADVAALRTALESKVDAFATKNGASGAGTQVAITVKDVAGQPAMVLDVTVPAAGKLQVPLEVAVGGGTDYSLRRSEMATGDTTTLEASWSSKIALKVAVPTNLMQAPGAVTVLPGTGVTEMKVDVGSTTVDLAGTLGPVEVNVGTSGAMKGVSTDPDDLTSELVRTEGTVAVSGTTTTAGSTLTDAALELSKLYTAGTATTPSTTKAKRTTTDPAECAATGVSGTGLLCDLPDPSATVKKDWVVGDTYTLAYSSTTVLADTKADFLTKKVAVGDVVYTYTLKDGARQKVGACEVATVAKHLLTCAAALTNSATFTAGATPTTYRVVQDALMSPGANFDKAGLVGSVVKNLTDKSECKIATATADSLTCGTAGLEKGTDNRWEPGDAYEIPGAATFQASYAFSLLGTATTPLSVTAYVGDDDDETTPANLVGKLGTGANAPTCDTAKRALCAALSLRTKPTDDQPDGTALGVLKLSATIGADGAPLLASTVPDAVVALKDGDTPMAFSAMGDAFDDAATSTNEGLDGSTEDASMPLVGSDPAAGTYLTQFLDLFGPEFSTQLQTVFATIDGETPLDAVGDGTESLDKVLQAAADAALEDLKSAAGGNPMADKITVEPEILCDEDPCNLDPDEGDVATIGDITDIKMPISIGDEATYQLPFSAGLDGMPLQADFALDSKASWDLTFMLGLSRSKGPYLDLADSDLTLSADVTFPDNLPGEKCPVATSDGAFSGDGPFEDYDSGRCQALTLGLLQATAYDAAGDDDRSQAKVELGVNLGDLVGLSGEDAEEAPAADVKKASFGDKLEEKGVSLVATGRLNVYFITGLNPDVGGGKLQKGSLPSVHGILDMGFNQPEEGEEPKNIWDINLNEDWSVDFGSLYLDAGSFVNDFAGPVIGGVADHVKPYKPLIDALRAPIPVVSDIAVQLGKPAVTPISVLENVTGARLGFVRKVLEVLDVVANLEDVGGTTLIPLGTSVPESPLAGLLPNGGAGEFSIEPNQVATAPCGTSRTINTTRAQANGANGIGRTGTVRGPALQAKRRPAPTNCAPAAPSGSPRGISKVVAKPCTKTATTTTTASCRSGSGASNISKYANRPALTGTAITFPFLEDFTEIFGLLMGEDANLVRLDLGTLNASAGVGLKFGPFMAGPVPVDIGVSFNIAFAAHLALGYDTAGIRALLDSEPGTADPTAMLDGLYVEDLDEAGNDVPEMTLTITVQVEGGVSVRIFRVGLYGGVTLTLAADLNDPDADGKLRFSEISSRSPACLFDFSGTLDFFFGFFVEVDLFIETLRYEVELWRLSPPLTLFKLTCTTEDPLLATTSADGKDLVLKLGPNAANRNLGNDKPDERVKVRQLSEEVADKVTRISVEMLGEYQEFDVPKGGRIIADSGDGRDVLEFLPGVDLEGTTFDFTVPVKADLGDGPDTANLGNGDNEVSGGAESDQITGGSGLDTLSGGEGDDMVAGGLRDDTVSGDGGSDDVTGDAGADTVDGGTGDDRVTGGPGLTEEQAEAARAAWEAGPDTGDAGGAAGAARVEDDADAEEPGPAGEFVSPQDLADVVIGGEGDDLLSGHLGDDQLFGENRTANPVSAFRSGACTGNAGTGTGDDTLNGDVGDDWLAGGPGDDSLTGGEGSDTLCGNGDQDSLDGDDGPTGEAAGNDELRGGDGDDRLEGRGGSDVADGGDGDDLVEGGEAVDLTLGGTGSDAVNSGDAADVVLGDTGTLKALDLTDGQAGVAGLGLPDAGGTAYEGLVKDHDAGGEDGSVTVCTTRVLVIRPTSSETQPLGKADVDGDGEISQDDDGRLDGYGVVDGLVDVDGDGDTDSADNGVVAGLPIGGGAFDVKASQALTALAWAGDGDADCLLGQDDDDAMFGGAGGDVLLEGLGDGLGVGGAGDDTVRGEDGVDVLRGSDDDDELLGDAGDDSILGNTGDDTAYGGADDDQVEGNEGDDTLNGGEGVDALVGGTTGTGAADGDDTVYGGQANDFIAGDNARPARKAGLLVGLQLEDVTGDKAAGTDLLSGGDDDDRIYGQGGADTIGGDADQDDIEGGPGSDVVRGGDGSDTIVGGSGTDTLTTGTARTTWAGTSDTGDELYGDAGNDTILGDNGVAKTRTLFDVPTGGSDPAAGPFGDDVVSGGTEGDRVYGQSGDDTLGGDAGNDVVDGNSGADTLRGGTEDDVLVGGSQQGATATVKGEKIDDRDRKPAGETAFRGDLVNGDAGDDVVLGDNGRVTGSGATASVEEYDVWRASGAEAPEAAGNDRLFGDAGRDRMFGQGLNDAMSGGNDDDAMSGDSGADTMAGDSGADDIVGGSGLAQLPLDLAGVRDEGDSLWGDAPGATATSGDADVILGDNGRISRSGTDPNTKQAARSTVLYDLAVVAKSLPSTLVSGNDVIRGNADRDLVYGQCGADTIDGDAGDDWLEGNTNPASPSGSPDTIRGGDGDDDVLGGSSNNVGTTTGVTGSTGTAGAGAFPATPNKVLDGGDRLWGDAGNDAVLGDNGRVDRAAAGSLWTYQSYKGSGETTAGKLLVRKVLSARADEGTGAYGDDEGHGGDGHDELYGQLGNDKLEGNAGDDSVLGDLGEVVTSVRTGSSKVVEASGFISETINVPGTLKRTTTTYPVPTSATSGGVGGTDVLLGGLGNDVTHGGAGNDQMWGNRSFVGSTFATLVPTKETSPVGISGLDDDVIFGGHGDDRAWGGWQHDRLYGGHGADQLDLVTVLNGSRQGDPTVDFKGIDFMYGGWGQDGMQADVSKPSPSNQTDKMVDGTGAYNGYFVCEGAYGGNSVMRLLSPAMESFWQQVAADDGLVSAASSKTSGWWELGMVYNADRGSNANPVYSLNPANFVCDS
ncbi:calcium-binding protein [Nocardioides sp. HDW12B]|uniref:calcium-binding protein n=1 Tax=Nocardioides sp. HDW12B TaxID=2714939 RepID=UPI001409AAE7|nr:calcium-binding protein [Nocardioides sp. HDW12B]QIK65874.1 calcium-binding protein [Nocardioides sp. HDW12B]